MPIWCYGFLTCTSLYSIWDGAKTIRQRRSTLWPKLSGKNAIWVGWLEIVINLIALMFYAAGIALHVTYK